MAQRTTTGRKRCPFKLRECYHIDRDECEARNCENSFSKTLLAQAGTMFRRVTSLPRLNLAIRRCWRRRTLLSTSKSPVLSLLSRVLDRA